MLKKLKHTILLILLVITACHAAFASEDPVYTNSLFGSAGTLAQNSTLYTYDGNFLSYRSRIEKTYSIKNRVILSIDEESPYYISSNFEVKLYLRITSKDTNNVSTVYNRSLTVNYSKDSGAKYTAAAYTLFEGGVDVTVKVDSIRTAASWDVSKVLKLKNEIQAQRDWAFNCLMTVPALRDSVSPGASLINIPGNGIMDERTILWGAPDMWVSEYDLEWAWVDESALPSYYDANGQPNTLKIFANNATRITTTQNSYHIPFFYDGSGRLFVRVRPAQVKTDGARLEGAWVYGANGIMSYSFAGHANALNWQATTTFAEEGKRKSVVQYFDGSLRGRQTVTKDNTTGTTVVAETMYDYQGRPVIQVLPAPTINTIIGFTKNFNQFDDAATGKSVYDKLDLNQGACSKLTKKLLATSGASQYYSPQNPQIDEGPNKYIPDAEGYPYTETRYTADGTGRIDAQGGLGTIYQINGGRETKYFYETPHQDELDGLFGTDAGAASHYSKNWVKDANGQYSISYVDMHGRTVATALSGSKPASLDPLPSYTNALKPVTRQLIDETNTVVGNSIIMSKPLMVAMAGNYTFNYSLSPDKFSLLNCNQQNVCYDCLYELNIKIVPDCAGTQINFTNPLVVKNFTLGQYLSQCTADGKSPGLSTTFTVPNLPEGSYTIVKELKMNMDAQAFYRDSIFKHNNVCRSLQDFITTQYNIAASQQNCTVTCAACTATLGSLNDFRERFRLQSGFTPVVMQDMEPQIVAAYNQALESCSRICNNSNSDGMEDIRNIRRSMLMDMTPPYGQYATIPTGNAGLSYNIFNPGPAALPAYRQPKDYNAATGSVSAVTDYKDQYLQLVQPYSNNAKAGLSPALWPQFATDFKASYAEQLLWAHPEFCKLKTVESTLKPSYQFEAAMQNTDTWSAANAAGYIQSLINTDPFFINVNAPGYQYRSQMLAAMNTNYFTSNVNNVCGQPEISMWKMAQYAVFCHRSSPSSPDANGCYTPSAETLDCFNTLSSGAPSQEVHCNADMNMVWKDFRSFYLSYRKSLIEQYLLMSCSAPSESFWDAHTEYTRRFITQASATAHLYNLGAVIDHNLIDGTGNDQTYSNAAHAEAESTCSANAENWMMKLRQCPDVNTYINNNPSQWLIDSAWLVKNLTSVCAAGLDYMGHPMGASSLPQGAPAVSDPTTGQQFRDFPQIVRYFLQSKGITITATCHPYLIDYPAQYDNAPPLVNQDIITKPSDCECERISHFKLLWEQSQYPGTFAAYLQNVHGTTINPDTLNLLIQMCTTGLTGTNCAYLTGPVALPAIFTCRGSSTSVKTCIRCKDYNTLKAEFTVETGLTGPIAHPQTQAEADLNHAFEAYANYKTGFTKSWMDYVDFEAQCAAAPSAYDCPSLQALQAQFFASPAHALNPSGINCQNAFAAFFNNATGESHTYTEWFAIFMQACNTPPDACLSELTCDLLEQNIQGFYDYYGVQIYQNTNVKDLFVLYMNEHLQASFTYEQYQERYAFLCGTHECSSVLDIDGSPGRFLAAQFFSIFRHNHPDPTVLDDCMQTFKEEFNAYFGTGMGTDEILALYHQYFPSGCFPDIDKLCDFPYSCKDLSPVLANFYAAYGTEISGQVNCMTAFTEYFNHWMHTSYSFAEIMAIYHKACGADIEICKPVYDCKALQKLIGKFTQTLYTAANCKEKFTAFFNNYYGTSHTWDEIYNIYKRSCDDELHICDNVGGVFEAEDLADFIQNFTDQYPAPVEELGIEDGKLVLTGMFNERFGTQYSYEDINNSYLVLTGDSLHIFESSCTPLAAWVNAYQSKYGAIKLPLAARQDLLAYEYSLAFLPPGKTAYPFEEVKDILGECNLLPFNMDHETGIYSLNDPQVLSAYKSTWYLMNPAGMPADCEDAFANWVNRTENTTLGYKEIRAKYEQFLGAGTGYICSVPEGVKVLTYEKSGSILMPGTPPIVPTGPIMCGLNEPAFPPPAIDTAGCRLDTTMVLTAAEEKYTLYLDSLKSAFDAAYHKKCESARYLESFTVTYSSADYHYTLYYYDQAGNLVKTVPPAGVDDRTGDQPFITQVRTARAAFNQQPTTGNPQPVTPNHTLTTGYRYNTLNQVVMQTTPDAGSSNFYYDVLGRLVMSRNAKQATAAPLYINSSYSYTLYDELGRIKEVGQVKPGGGLQGIITQARTRNPQLLTASLTGKPADQITRTTYDKSYYDGDGTLCPDIICQHNLRNRVSYTAVYPTGTPGVSQAGTHTTATIYSYDIHGGVDTIVQDINMEGFAYNVVNGIKVPTGNRWKKFNYSYDLVSGNMKEVNYQSGAADEFHYKYSYDAENKLTDVETSTDRIIWEHDAKYSYYKNGWMSRSELGQQKIQGLDYAYTLQNWKKGVNSTSMDGGNFDMGEDGKVGSNNALVARDAFGFSLNYYNGDYKTINATTSSSFTGNVFNYNNLDGMLTAKPLYDGNMASMFVNIPKLGDAQLYGYGYDQLNRIISMDAFKGFNNSSNNWVGAGPTPSADYKERIAYDANGNIKTYLRNGNAARTSMDNMTYTYKSGTNQLDKVADAASDAGVSDYDKYNDIKQGQNDGNYKYDEMGNLVQDKSENIFDPNDPARKMIEWNNNGKINKVIKIKDGVTSEITYSYDAGGNRISKTAAGKTTWYVRNANANIFSTYETGGINAGALTQTEIQLYGGTGRLGILNVNNDMTITQQAVPIFMRGNKYYELTNHLGNVLATVSDKKIGVDDGRYEQVCTGVFNPQTGMFNQTCIYNYASSTPDGIIDYYEPDVVSANDYYVFGMTMPGRIYQNDKYRYGFNGKEKEKGIAAGDLDFGARIYDSRLGRFLSIDPLAYVHAFNSPYQFAANKPIIAVDADGLLDIYVTVSIKGKDGKVTSRSYPVIHITTAEEVIYGLQRTPIYVQVNAHVKDQSETNYSTEVNEMNNFGLTSGGYDKFESIQAASSPLENFAVSGAVGFSKMTGVSGFMEATDGETVEGVQLNTTNRVISGVAGAEKFASLVTAKGGCAMVGGIVSDMIQEKLVDMMVEDGMDLAFGGNTEKSVINDQNKELFKTVYTIAKEAGGSKSELIRIAIAFLQAGSAAQKMEAAAKANVGGKLPYGPDEAMNQAVNLFLQPGGWGDSREHRDELTAPTEEPAIVTADKNKKE